MPSKSGNYQFGVHVVDARGVGDASPFQLTVSNASNVGVTLNPSTATVPSSGTMQFTATVSNTATWP